MKKTLFLTIALLIGVSTFSQPWKKSQPKISKEQADALFDLTHDESYQKVVPLNILTENSYLHMAREGWTAGEIIRLTDDYLEAHKAQLKANGASIEYSKHWRPYYVSSNLMNATISNYTTPSLLEKAKANVLVTQLDPNAYYSRIFYTVNDRLAGIRNNGTFRQNAIMPAGGRITWMTVNPDNADKLMVVPDGQGIWRTNDMGKTWDCITNRIPNRYDRNTSDSYSIPVDPDNWDHVFAFMAGSVVYETNDGGLTWRKITGAAHKGFKRGYCFRDANGNLKFIGAKPVNTNGLGAQLWLSSDTCKTWTSISSGTASNFWFQEIAFHPTDRNIIYAAGTKGILRTTDGGTTWALMSFNVYGATTATLRSAATKEFPLATAASPMFLQVNPNNGNEMWAALSSLTSTNTALYKTTDGGQNWITLQEPSAGIGSGIIFGNSSAQNWTGCFGVNFANTNYIYGAAMACGESSNGGKDFTLFNWTNSLYGYYPDGTIEYVSSATHNADNHVIKGHKSGRVFRGCDAGLLVKDPAINGYKWTNITGNMSEMLFYASATNEFGDFSIVGNTQDINVQTYHGGRWGQTLGYEGSTVWMNPFSGEEHYSSTRSGRTDLLNQDYGSWNKAWSKADLCTGNWFLRREKPNVDGSCFFVIKDVGKTPIGLDNTTTGFVQDFALSRDVPGGKLFIVRNNKAYVSTDGGVTFTFINLSNLYSPTKIAVNPDNSKEIYLAKLGGVYCTLDGGATWKNLTTPAIIGISLKSFYYHEGSGDLYFVSPDHGIFIREAGTTDWKLWNKGYNTAKLTDAQINYTTQEMILTDYGSGIWIADLQHPADRFLKDGFALKQISNINNARTFGIDVFYTIPLYYYYKWYVNGVLKDKETGQYFTSSMLKADDKVKLEVTLRQSPDITTHSVEFTVVDEVSQTVPNTRGNYLNSNGLGRLDLGYVDQFFGNFTLQLWVNPKSDGVILANRQVNTNGVKGFYVGIKSGVLSFNYTPENNFSQAFNESSKNMHFAVSAGSIPLNNWTQITITHSRTGNICLYVNGDLKVTKARGNPTFTLNNSMYLSLFADGYELNPINASVDELKIWNEVLDQTTVRQSMYGNVNPSDAKMIYYNDFNAATLATQKERFSQKGMAPKMKAVVTVNESALGVCATDNEYKAITTSWTSFSKNGVKALEIKSSDATFLPNVSGLFYEGLIMGSNTNLPTAYYGVYPTAFGVKMFDVTDFTKTVDLKFYLDPALAASYDGGKIYTLDLNANTEAWVELTATPVYNSVDNSMTITGIKASDINNKRIVIAKIKAAIELSSTSFPSAADLNVFTPDTVKVPFQASLIGGMVAPSGTYTLLANSPIVKKIDPLVFSNNVATSTASIVLADNDLMDERIPVTISGQDISLKPYLFTTVNKITSKMIKTGIKMNLGGATVGSGATFAGMNGKNTATFSTWVRLDDATMLTGYHMLVFFRGSATNATGLALYNGKLCCYWNNESWSWEVLKSINSGLKLTTSDIGKWVHIAMTASPTGLEFYLNGKKGNSVVRTINPTVIGDGLMLGKDQSTDATFIGAFDQVTVWNRTLTQQEILKYMHSRTLLNEPGIISYLTFDKQDVNGNYFDLKSNAAVTFNGVVDKNQVSNIPFNFVTQQSRTKELNDGVVSDSVGFTLPSGYPTSSIYYTSRFKGLLYNSIDIKYPNQVLLEDSYRTISFAAIRDFTPDERVQFTVENPAIAAGDSVIFYARSLGSLAAFTTRYSVLAQAGKAIFDVPATVFNENLTYLFYRLPHVANGIVDNNVYRYKLTIDNGYCTILNLQGNADITFFDISGRVICSNHTHDKKYAVELPKGIYIVKIAEYGVACMTKIIL